MLSPLARIGIAGLLSLVLTLAAGAAPIFSAYSELDNNGGFFQYDYTGAPLHFENTYGGLVEAGAFAGVSGLGAFGRAEVINNNYRGVGRAYATYDDFVVQGPNGFVATSLNLNLGGSLAASSNNLPNYSTGIAHVGVQIYVNGQIITDSQELYLSSSGVLQVTKTGMFQNWNPSPGTLTTPQFIVSANTPFTLRVILDTYGSANGSSLSHSGTSGASEFAHTLTFATSGNVFNLPTGYTANSADAGIQNNLFVVPELSTSTMLLGAGSLFLAGLGIRSRKSQAQCADESVDHRATG